jgi:hypothetical protein
MALILDGTNGLSDVDGSAATPAIRGSDTNTGIFFPAADTIAFAEGGVESMRLDSAGNVGIGTSSPAQKLDVSGSGGVSLRVTSTNSSAQLVLNSSGTNVGYINYNTGGAGALAFYDSNSASERARIDSSGNLLVGTTSVGGDGVSIQPRVSSGGTTQITFNRASATQTGDAVAFNNGGTRVGTITYNNTTTAYLTSSDYRLKHDIQPMTGALAKVAQLKPVTYKWNADDSQSQGFIAHELQEVVPECVTGEKDAVDAEGKPQYQGIDTSFLVATLTAAIQEQQAIITALTARVEALEGAQT